MSNHRSGYYRLIAFWAICEAFAGGLMHAFKIPFTGMIIGSLSVTSILLIGHYYPGKGNILRATLLVCIVKAMLSPHSPPTAYIAVAFQGTAGSILFSVSRLTTVLAMVLGAAALIESAIQRVLVLWLIYGNQFWKSVDAFLVRLSGRGSEEPVSGYVALGYIGIHALTGILVGWYIKRVILKTNDPERYRLPEVEVSDSFGEVPLKKRKKIRWAMIIIWVLIACILIQSYASPAHSVIAPRSAWFIILRALLILGLWYAILGPLMKKWILKRLDRAKHQHSDMFKEVYALLPKTWQELRASWTLAGKNRRGLGRIDEFIKVLVFNIRPEAPSPLTFK